jgi:hypothetical protein
MAEEHSSSSLKGIPPYQSQKRSSKQLHLTQAAKERSSSCLEGIPSYQSQKRSSRRLHLTQAGRKQSSFCSTCIHAYPFQKMSSSQSKKKSLDKSLEVASLLLLGWNSSVYARTKGRHRTKTGRDKFFPEN